MIALVPGFLQSPEDLSELAAALEARDVGAVRLDLLELARGRNAEDAARRLLDALPGPDAVLVGYSMGARLCLAAALAAPRRIRGLVLLSGSPGLVDDAARRERRALDEERACTLERDPEAFVSSWGALPLFAPLRATPAFERLQARRRTLIRGPRATAWASVLRALGPGAMPSLWPSLPRLDVPVLLLSGALDEAYVQHAQRAAALLSRPCVDVVDGVGHALPLEAPDAVADRLRAFVASLAPTPTAQMEDRP